MRWFVPAATIAHACRSCQRSVFQVYSAQIDSLCKLFVNSAALIQTHFKTERGKDLIAHITGKLIQKQPNSVIVDVGGVGYELIVPLSTFYDLGEDGAVVSLRVHTHVREDALQLFGFRTEREKKLFLLLVSVSGIGPKLAITVLSGLSAEELVQAIRTSNLVKLVGIPGVGKKTAERMLVELKDKVAAILPPGLEEPASLAAQSSEAMREDVISALVNLGYQKAQAERALNAVLKQTPDAKFEAALKSSLRSLAS